MIHRMFGWLSGRVWQALPILLVGAVGLGCSHSGDFSSFVVREVAGCGGRTNTNAAPPALEAHWKVRSDKNGFEAVVTGTTFSEVDNVMRQAFGTPMMSGAGSSTTPGPAYGNWSARDIGVAILILETPEGVKINCVKGFNDAGELLNAVKR